eukprot:7675578-Alexandrium_andersonii.AAC.1
MPRFGVFVLGSLLCAMWLLVLFALWGGWLQKGASSAAVTFARASSRDQKCSICSVVLGRAWHLKHGSGVGALECMRPLQWQGSRGFDVD